MEGFGADAAAVTCSSPVDASYVRDLRTSGLQHERNVSTRNMDQSICLPMMPADATAVETQQAGAQETAGVSAADEQVSLAAAGASFACVA